MAWRKRFVPANCVPVDERFVLARLLLTLHKKRSLRAGALFEVLEVLNKYVIYSACLCRRRRERT